MNLIFYLFMFYCISLKFLLHLVQKTISDEKNNFSFFHFDSTHRLQINFID